MRNTMMTPAEQGIAEARRQATQRTAQEMKKLSSRKNWIGATLAVENIYTKQTYYGRVIEDDGKAITLDTGDERVCYFTRNTVWTFRYFRYFGE